MCSVVCWHQCCAQVCNVATLAGGTVRWHASNSSVVVCLLEVCTTGGTALLVAHHVVAPVGGTRAPEIRSAHQSSQRQGASPQSMK